MNITVNRKFLKDLAKLPADQQQKIEQLVFVESERITLIEEIKGIKKLQGYQIYYRIRFGDYRVGIRHEDEAMVFERVLHRKDIYRYFP